MRKRAATKRLQEIQKKRRELTQQLQEVRDRRNLLSRQIEKFWMDLGAATTPKTYGEYLHGLIAKAEMVVFAKEKEDELYLDEINKRMHNYSIGEKLAAFISRWRDDSYARVSVGHKLAAVLMLTSVPDDIEVKAPWGHWLLEIPDGSYPFKFSAKALEKGLQAHQAGEDVNIDMTATNEGDETTHQIRAILCEGDAPKQLLLEINNNYFILSISAEVKGLLNNYVKGVCLSFDERKSVREGSWARSEKQRREKLPGYGRQYTFSHTVTVDFREEVRQLLANPHKHAHTSQWLVRGHWRNQACGHQMQDRRRIRIEPYWKGPEEARILLRGHRLV